MNNASNGECGAKVKATCRKHGWIKNPANAKEAKADLVDAQMRLQTVSGRTGFLAAKVEVEEAALVYNSTPEGQKELTRKIKEFKEKGFSTVGFQSNLAEARHYRAVQEVDFQIAVVTDKLDRQSYPDINSSEGKKLFKELEKIAGEDIDNSNWGQAIYETRASILRQSHRRYKKSFENRLAVDLKEKGLSKKLIARGRKEYYIKNSDGDKIARFELNIYGEVKEAKVVLNKKDGTLKTIFTSNEFRSWVQAQKNAPALPDWAL